MRYGAMFRGDKALLAEEKGASGILLYSDPYNFASNINKKNMVLILKLIKLNNLV